MNNLLHLQCQSQAGAAPMSAAEIGSHLGQVSGWRLHGSAIEKTFKFKNYFETIAFVNALAWICHSEDHHPEQTVTFDHCVVRFNTHEIAGVSINDFICAAKADALVAFIA